jgi:hypothetical protein
MELQQLNGGDRSYQGDSVGTRIDVVSILGGIQGLPIPTHVALLIPINCDYIIEFL